MSDLARKPTNEKAVRRMPSPAFLESLGQELLLTGATFQIPITELIVVSYREALQDLSRSEIERGFREARKKLKFFPRPADVRELAANSEPTHYHEPEPLPVETPEQRAESKRVWESLFPPKPAA